MSRPKARPGPTSPRRSRPGPRPPLRLDPEEQRAALAKLLADQSVQPVEDLDAFLAEARSVWPEQEDLDGFTDWLRQLRRGELA